MQTSSIDSSLAGLAPSIELDDPPRRHGISRLRTSLVGDHDTWEFVIARSELEPDVSFRVTDLLADVSLSSREGGFRIDYVPQGSILGALAVCSGDILTLIDQNSSELHLELLRAGRRISRHCIFR
jgi:hypothetical protein